MSAASQLETLSRITPKDRRERGARADALGNISRWLNEVYPTRQSAMLQALGDVASDAAEKKAGGFRDEKRYIVPIADASLIEKFSQLAAAVINEGPFVTDEESPVLETRHYYTEESAYRVHYAVRDLPSGLLETLDAPFRRINMFVTLNWVNKSVTEVSLSMYRREGHQSLCFKFILSRKGLGVSVMEDGAIHSYENGPVPVSHRYLQDATELLSSLAAR